MHLDDRVPILLGHVDEHPVSKDAGVVDQHVQVAEGRHGSVDQILGTLGRSDVIAVGQRLPAECPDLVHDLLSGAPIIARPVDGSPEVVHDHLGAFGGEQKGVLTTQAAAGTRDDRHSPFECSHVVLLLRFPASWSENTTVALESTRSAGNPLRSLRASLWAAG